MTTPSPSWQPIETAPKDRMILLYVPKGTVAFADGAAAVVAGRWIDVPFEDMALGYNDWRARGHWNAVKLSIMELIGSGRCYFNSSFNPIQPSHWMPYPNPPEE